MSDYPLLIALTYVCPTLICVSRFVHYVVVLFKAVLWVPGLEEAPVLGPGDAPDDPGRVHPLGRPDRPHRTRRRPRNHRQSRRFSLFLTFLIDSNLICLL